jgi:hypothetical protein
MRNMNKANIEFPVICFYGKLIRVADSYDSLTRTTKAGVKNGMFRDLFIVDRTETEFYVKDAKKLHGIGIFGGWNIFLNQKIRVQLEIDEEPKKITLDEVKQKVLKSFSSWHGWSSGGNLPELKRLVQEAASVEGLASVLE